MIGSGYSYILSSKRKFVKRKKKLEVTNQKGLKLVIDILKMDIPK